MGSTHRRRNTHDRMSRSPHVLAKLLLRMPLASTHLSAMRAAYPDVKLARKYSATVKLVDAPNTNGDAFATVT